MMIMTVTKMMTMTMTIMIAMITTTIFIFNTVLTSTSKIRYTRDKRTTIYVRA